MILDANSVCGLIDNNLAELIHTIIVILKFCIPILLVVLGMLDLGKGVIAGKEDEIKKGQQMFIKRLISAVFVFFVVTIVQLVVGFVDDKNSGVMDCVNLILNGNKEPEKQYENKDCCKIYNGEFKEGKCVFENADTNTIVEYHNCIGTISNNDKQPEKKYEDDNCCKQYNGEFKEGKCVFENADTNTIVEYHSCVGKE